MIQIWRPWKLSSFQDPSTPLSSYVQNSPIPLSLDFQFLPLSPSPSDNQSIKKNIIQGWLLYVTRSFLQVGFCSQYQFINLVWLSIDFFPFSWSQPRPQSYFKKLKTCLSASSFSEKMCCGRGWAEASRSAFLWLYILVCAVV